VSAARLLLAIDAMAELGAFQRATDPAVNSLIRDVRAQVPSDGLTEDGYRAEVERFANDFPLYLDTLRAEGRTLSEQILALEATLTPENMQRVSNGATLQLATLQTPDLRLGPAASYRSSPGWLPPGWPLGPSL
jgi:hypothetical protein